MRPTGGFELAGKEKLLDAGVFSIESLSVRTPSGAIVEREVMHHPGAVGAVVVDEGDVVLVRQYRAALGKELLEIPAGKRDVSGEPPELTMGRELAEEVGLVPGKLELLCSLYTSPGCSDEEVLVYLATDCKRTEREPHGPEEEAMQTVRVPVSELRALLATGEVRDAKTLVGLLSFLQRGT